MRPNLDEVACVDIETFFDKDYSLRSKELNMSGYIRDERFLMHCISIKLGRAPTQVYWYADIEPALRAIDWNQWHFLAHNTSFDAFALSQHYNIVIPEHKRLYLDTLSMARALHAGSSRADLDTLARLYGLSGKNQNILGKMKGHREIPHEIREEASLYCAADVDKCFAIFERMVEVFPEDELKLIDWTLRQFIDPVLLVDIPRAQAELDREIAQKAALVAKVGLDPDELQSATKLANQMRALGVEPPMKESARTKLITYAFSQGDEEFMALGAHPDERVRDLIAARLAVKSTIGETRAKRFVDIGEKPLPVGLNFAAAHTLRWGGANKMNLQNLEKEEKNDDGTAVPCTGELRKSIIAPPGHMVCVADSGQIEARITAYLAQQTDLLDLFAADGDPYCALASDIYGTVVTKLNRDRRAVGKAGVLGLGFYMGAARFQGTLALGLLGPKMLVDIEFAQNVVDTYRAKNKKIVALWRSMGTLLFKMLLKARGMDKAQYSTHKFAGLEVEFDSQSIWLPTGMGLHYPDLRAEYNERTGGFYDYTYRSNNEVHRIHAGVLTENCIAAGTEVLTALGWKAIEELKLHDLVHDGVEFVQHAGLLYKSVQPCVIIDGVHMTPDHEVLTNEGWKAASENPKPYRPSLWALDCIESGAQRREIEALAIPVQVRNTDCSGFGRYPEVSQEGRHPKLRVSHSPVAFAGSHDARYEQTSGFCGVAIDARPLRQPITPGLEELRSARNSSMRRVAEIIRGFLGRHGGNLLSWPGFRPNRQRRALHTDQLSLDYQTKEHNEQTYNDPLCRYSRTIKNLWDRALNIISPLAQRVADREPHTPTIAKKQVYDVANCGPRQRFVVKGEHGPFIVHNCVQRLARDVVAGQLLEINKRYRVVLMCHDEVVALAPEAEAEECQNFMLQQMTIAPKWLPGLPLKAEGGFDVRYSK